MHKKARNQIHFLWLFAPFRGHLLSVVEVLRELEEEMQEAASKLEFEKAALLRDQIMELKKGAASDK